MLKSSRAVFAHPRGLAFLGGLEMGGDGEKLTAEWFWIDRWMGSSAFLLPIEPRGLYREMLSQAWRRGARLPNDHDAIRRACGVTEAEWGRCWPLLERYWIVDGDGLVNATQLEVFAEAKGRAERASEHGRKGALGRYSGGARAGAREDTRGDARAAREDVRGEKPPSLSPSEGTPPYPPKGREGVLPTGSNEDAGARAGSLRSSPVPGSSAPPPGAAPQEAPRTAAAWHPPRHPAAPRTAAERAAEAAPAPVQEPPPAPRPRPPGPRPMTKAELDEAGARLLARSRLDAAPKPRRVRREGEWRPPAEAVPGSALRADRNGDWIDGGDEPGSQARGVAGTGQGATASGSPDVRDAGTSGRVSEPPIGPAREPGAEG